ncbi:hypothetical protein QUB70_13525 [Microcoleus sp. A003_D6]
MDSSSRTYPWGRNDLVKVIIYPFWVLVVFDRGQYSTTWRSPNQKAIALSLKSVRATDNKRSYRIEERSSQ